MWQKKVLINMMFSYFLLKASLTYSSDRLTPANKFIHKYVWYFFVKGTLNVKKPAHMFKFQTPINLAKQLITILKLNSLLQINMYVWERCTSLFLKANLNGIKLIRHFHCSLANTLIDNIHVTSRRLNISILCDFIKHSL